MSHSQHYQPLSHALNPALAGAPSRSPYSTSSVYTPPPQPASIPAVRQPQPMQEDLQDDEDQEDDDEGIVEGQLELNSHDRREAPPASPPRTTFLNNGHEPSIQIVQDPGHSQEKRRPGRPRGSKNRKPRAPPGSKSAAVEQPQGHGPPPHPDLTPANQQYYEFQWRVLNLCTEFYGAAEELVKGTNPLVIAQCYHMGPGVKLDPLTMLSDAKRICDTLLANPSQLVANPPPPMYPPLPTLYGSGNAPPGAASSSTAPVITNAQSFVVPLGGQAPGYVSTTAQYPVFATPGQYATAPYYQYPYAAPPPPPSGYYPQAQAQAQAQPQTQAQQQQPTVSQPVASTSTQGTPAPAPVVTTTVTAAGVVNSGPWTDEENERLRQLAEDSKSHTANGEMDWEYVIRHFGDGRTRHQILIRATAMGLKESTTRAPKRRRGGEEEGAASAAAAAQTQATVASPEHQHSATPQASPALQSVQRPGSSSNATPAPGATAGSTSTMPWPMPTMAINTASPLLPSSSSSSSLADQQPRASYYRPRPTDGASQANKQVNPYSLFTANGHSRGDGR
ncbi:hypothetical protein FA13DRAFT_1738608 [Coprinellus micaceus]|uniref:Myb-like domain-containing protein n=1 Tax=Coprinellus micaceus TaxID=71717 RepID=A0A4Y7SUA9_COPMI|nr:hypothetical protein FA13DRAFT_1738608 [Coprinellus micaceus]